ncbi:MAG: ATP-binding protein [Bacteroidota bacterium]
MTNNKSLKIAIASGKGGTGKTLLATNMAAFLSLTQKILLVDLDVEEPNDFLFLNGKIVSESDQYKMIPEWDENKCILCGTCSDVCKFHSVIQLGKIIAVFKELCHSCYACSELCPTQALPMQKHKMGESKTISSGNLTFIESRLNVGEEQAVPLINQTHALVDNKHNDIQIQLFDCPPGTSCPVVAATKNTDFVILVTEPTPFGLNDLKLAVETMQKIGKPIGVVINRYGIGNLVVESYCEKEQIPVLAKISFDRKIAEAYSNGELVFDKIEQISTSLHQIFNMIKNTVNKHE